MGVSPEPGSTKHGRDAHLTYMIAVKVVDIFGNDRMTIVDVTVGEAGRKKK